MSLSEILKEWRSSAHTRGRDATVARADLASLLEAKITKHLFNLKCPSEMKGRRGSAPNCLNKDYKAQ